MACFSRVLYTTDKHNIFSIIPPRTFHTLLKSSKAIRSGGALNGERSIQHPIYKDKGKRPELPGTSE